MNLGNLITLLAIVLPKLKDYFTQNKGLNTVSGGILGSLLTLLVLGMQDTATVDQLITWLQNNGTAGIIAGAVVAGLRTAVFTYAASKRSS